MNWSIFENARQAAEKNKYQKKIKKKLLLR